MYVGVIKSREQKFAGGVQNFCLWAAPSVNLRVAADGDDAVGDNGNRLGCGMLLIYGPNFCVVDGKAGSGLGLRVRTRRPHEPNYTNKASAIIHAFPTQLLS